MNQGVIDTQWVPLRVFGPDSAESEQKFHELSQVDSGELGSGVQLLSHKDYSDLLAPLFQANDFSTATLMKNEGSNLTAEKLAELTVPNMIDRILQKTGLIGIERLMRILTDACAVASLDAPDIQSVADHLATRTFVMPDLATYIANADLMFDDNPR